MVKRNSEHHETRSKRSRVTVHDSKLLLMNDRISMRRLLVSEFTRSFLQSPDAVTVLWLSISYCSCPPPYRKPSIWLSALAVVAAASRISAFSAGPECSMRILVQVHVHHSSSSADQIVMYKMVSYPRRVKLRCVKPGPDSIDHPKHLFSVATQRQKCHLEFVPRRVVDPDVAAIRHRLR